MVLEFAEENNAGFTGINYDNSAEDEFVTIFEGNFADDVREKILFENGKVTS